MHIFEYNLRISLRWYIWKEDCDCYICCFSKDGEIQLLKNNNENTSKIKPFKRPIFQRKASEIYLNMFKYTTLCNMGQVLPVQSKHVLLCSPFDNNSCDVPLLF